jgi:hypothetical protein
MPLFQWLQQNPLDRRNRKKLAKLLEADVVLLRYPKSGVTWLRVMISRVYQIRLGLPDSAIVGRSGFHRLHPGIPNIFIAMDNFNLPRQTLLQHLQKRKVIFLLRDPRDVAVSLYFHFAKRATQTERQIYSVPESVQEKGVYDFVMSADFGITKVVDFMNFWFAALQHHPRAVIIRYEELRQDPEHVFEPVMKLLQPNVTQDELRAAVEFASFERMKEKEASSAYGVEILRPGMASDSDSYKVRRGKVGGYADYFSETEKAGIDSLVRRELNSDLGYWR